MIDYKISMGEFFDRMSILGVKISNIKDKTKTQRAKAEFDLYFGELNHYIGPRGFVKYQFDLFNILRHINESLWELEDKVRTKPDIADYINITKLNDLRADIKRKIDAEFGDIGEQKEHKLNDLSEEEMLNQV